MPMSWYEYKDNHFEMKFIYKKVMLAFPSEPEPREIDLKMDWLW